jgi:hypothetical protein
MRVCVCNASLRLYASLYAFVCEFICVCLYAFVCEFAFVMRMYSLYICTVCNIFYLSPVRIQFSTLPFKYISQSILDILLASQVSRSKYSNSPPYSTRSPLISALGLLYDTFTFKTEKKMHKVE